MKKLIALLLISVLLCLPSNLYADRGISKRYTDSKNKLALVIGNGKYRSTPLKNPVNDARDMSRVLKRLGFKVFLEVNASQRTMKKVIRRFGAKLRKTGGAGLFYYAGHGLQINGRNYLIPVDIDVDSVADVEDEAVKANFVLNKMRDARNNLNILILDACRNNPFRGISRSVDRGLAQMQAPKGSMIIYSTSPGKTAADGKGRNGIFTKYLIKHMQTPGQPIERVLKKVRNDVSEETQDRQIPWESSSLTGDFMFVTSSGAFVEKPLRESRANRQNTASFSVNCNVKGAKVYVDGMYKGTTNTNGISVKPGSRYVSVVKGGYETYEKRVVFKRGRSTSLYAYLDKKKEPKAKLYIDTTPSNASVKIFNIGSSFYNGMNLKKGRYRVQISKSGYKTKTFWVSLRSGEDKNLDIRLQKATSGLSGRSFRNSLGQKFVYIKAGSFMMGSNSGSSNEKPLHKVRITRGFYMQTTEVTQRQWRSVMGNNPSEFSGDRRPVENVSWNDVKRFIDRLNSLGTKKYRLPQEAEWEYAARAGSSSKYSFGNSEYDLRSYAWYSKNSRRRTCDVGTKRPNRWGLYDMHGNVWEWCSDWYGKYSSGSKVDPTGPYKGGLRVARGGSWLSLASACRSSVRNWVKPVNSFHSIGFRLVCLPVQ